MHRCEFSRTGACRWLAEGQRGPRILAVQTSGYGSAVRDGRSRRYGGAPQCSAATLKGRYQRLCEAIIGQHCDSCATRAACRVWEAVVQRRLQWAIWCECATCGPTEEFGWDETPPESRQALLDQCGVFRLRVSPGTQFSRVRLMKELRAMGVSMAEVPAAMDDLLSAGMTGTEVEMQLLAMKLQGSGVETAIAKVSSGSE